MSNWDDIFKRLNEWDFEFDFIEGILGMDDAEEVLHNKLEKALDAFDNGNYEETNIILDFALLLGELKSERSLPLFLRILSYDDDDIHKILGDMLFEVFPFVIYSTGENQLDEIAEFLGKKEISEWNRASALASLTWMVKTTPEKRKIIIQVLREAFQVEELQSFLIMDIFDHNLFELEELARKTFASGEFDPQVFTEEDLQFNSYEQNLRWDTLDKAYNHLFSMAEVNREYMNLIEDETFVKGFGMYEGIEDEMGIPFNIMSGDYFDIPQPRTSTKVGRNEPCPCGSNKKYKKCCGK